MKAYIVHEFYGCESGCCGHQMYLIDDDGRIIKHGFDFIHPNGEDKRSFAESMLSAWPPARGVEIDWLLCDVVDD